MGWNRTTRYGPFTANLKDWILRCKTRTSLSWNAVHVCKDRTKKQYQKKNASGLHVCAFE